MGYLVSEFIDDILDDLAQPSDITAFWDRAKVLKAIDKTQREISQITECILAVTSLLEPAAAATTITIDANGNFIRGFYATRTYGGFTKPIFFYTTEQLYNSDAQWSTRTSSIIRGLTTDITSEGIARLYPIPDNADNDIYVYYIKLATRLTAEFTEAGDASNQLASWTFEGVSSTNVDATYKMYWTLANSGTTRTVNIYKDSAKANLVASGSRTGDGSITLSEQNNSGLTGSVTVTYTVDDSDSANILTFNTLELATSELPCLEYGVKGYLYGLETDGKDTGIESYWKRLYGARTPEGYITGELMATADRARKRRAGTYSMVQDRLDTMTIRTRPLFEWEV